MEGEGALFIVVEFAVGMAGFGGIIVALTGRGGEGDQTRLFEFADLLSLFANALGAAFLALVPVALGFLDVAPASIWRIASGLVVTFQLSMVAFGMREARRLGEPLPAYYKRFAWTVGGVVLLLQLANIAGVPREPGIAFFFIALLWHLAFAAIGFVRLVARYAS